MGQLVAYAAKGKLRPLAPVSRSEPLPGPLVALLQMATHPEPGRRYPSVRALADDLRGYRLDEPIHAAPESFRAQLGRLLARRREATFNALVILAVGVALAMGGVLISGSSLALGLQYRVQQQAARWSSTVTEVGDRAARLDRALSLVEAQLIALDEAAEVLLVEGVPEAGDVVFPPARFGDPQRRPPDTAWSAQYDRPLSTRWPAVVAAPDTSLTDVEPTLRRLLPLRRPATAWRASTRSPPTGRGATRRAPFGGPSWGPRTAPTSTFRGLSGMRRASILGSGPGTRWGATRPSRGGEVHTQRRARGR